MTTLAEKHRIRAHAHKCVALELGDRGLGEGFITKTLVQRKYKLFLKRARQGWVRDMLIRKAI